jgi:hypothetical protein
MKLRFIEYDKEIMVVVGFSYIQRYDPPECYVAVPLADTLVQSLFQMHTINVPFIEAKEITDPNRIKALVVLYGR